MTYGRVVMIDLIISIVVVADYSYYCCYCYYCYCSSYCYCLIMNTSSIPTNIDITFVIINFVKTLYYYFYSCFDY